MTVTKRTARQSKQLFGLWNKLHIDEAMRRDMIVDYTNGRTDSSKEMTYDEAYKLIGNLRDQVSSGGNANIAEMNRRANNMRRLAIHIIYNLPGHLGFYNSDGGKKRFNAAAFDEYLKNGNKSPFKGRTFNSLKVNELNKLIRLLNKWKSFYDNRITN